MDLVEENLRAELERARVDGVAESDETVAESESGVGAFEEEEYSKTAVMVELENKRKDLVCLCFEVHFLF